MFFSPLRYPGGKGKLEPFMELLIKQTGHFGGTYVEPFAGGAGIALELLEKEIVNEIVINDLDKGIYSFWRAILTETNRFIDDIRNVELTVNEWNRQRQVIDDCRRYSYELGFATFYMNRTNRSGIIKGGVIGGVEQAGTWKMNARFNREGLIERIAKIAEKKSRIHLYNKDVSSFVLNYLPRYQQNAFVYFDPPYFEKGKQLYLNFFSYNDHVRIERMIDNIIILTITIMCSLIANMLKQIGTVCCNHNLYVIYLSILIICTSLFSFIVNSHKSHSAAIEYPLVSYLDV